MFSKAYTLEIRDNSIHYCNGINVVYSAEMNAYINNNLLFGKNITSYSGGVALVALDVDPLEIKTSINTIVVNVLGIKHFQQQPGVEFKGRFMDDPDTSDVTFVIPCYLSIKCFFPNNIVLLLKNVYGSLEIETLNN